MQAETANTSKEADNGSESMPICKWEFVTKSIPGNSYWPIENFVEHDLLNALSKSVSSLL
jgi:hypothetical protein